MNRKLIGVLLTVALLVLAAAPVFAEQKQVDIYEGQELVKSVAFVIGVNEYFVNDQTPGTKMDVAPYIASGRTFVPVRFLGNALGIPNYDITWDGDKSQAALKRGDILLTMVIGKKETVTNGVKRAIDVAPVIKNARTFLPARFVAEGLGYNVDWDAEHNIVICWPKGEAKPDLTNVVNYTEKADDYVNVSGYMIPKETDIRVEGSDIYTELTLNLKTNYPFQKQIDQLRGILTPKLGEQVTEEIIAYVNIKGTDMDVALEQKYWDVADKRIGVGSGWHDNWIEVMIWPLSAWEGI